MLRQTPNRRHRWLAPANSDLDSPHEPRPGHHPMEVHTQAGPTQVSLHNQAVEARSAAFSSRAPPSELPCRWSNRATTGLEKISGNNKHCVVLSSITRKPLSSLQTLS